jgi:hypothetical protein
MPERQLERSDSMWVFDGEEWRQDDESESLGTIKPKAAPVRVDEFVPELQVIEVVEIPRPHVRHFPLP